MPFMTRFVPGLAPGQQLASDPASESKEDEPKLCPEPARDTPHGSSERAKDYEDDVHARVNPLAPLPREFGVNLPNPLTGQTAFFDDCFAMPAILLTATCRGAISPRPKVQDMPRSFARAAI